uniref:Uncharacterized protein n=1 Tax=viral metagenome TaxID=1070528 RepID=A0A6C0J3K9_9ZZZZ
MNYNDNRSLIGIITGMERSGTTVLHNLINSHSQITSGFECGILLGTLNNFEQNEPFGVWMRQNRYQFGLEYNKYLDDIKDMTYKEVYQYIGKNKGSHGGHFQSIMHKSKYFIDKTPRYIYELESVIKKIEGIYIPIIIILKDFDYIYFSQVYKRNQDINEFTENIEKCIKTMEFLENNFYSNIYLFQCADAVKDKKKLASRLMNILKEYTPNLEEEELSFERWKKKLVVDEKDELYPYRHWTDVYFIKVPIPLNLQELKEKYNKLLFKLKMEI